MARETDFNERYKTGDTPWDHGAPDRNLIDTILQRPIAKCRALEIGCGTGDNAIWLARQYFAVTACDISQVAIEKASDKASAARVDCSFIAADFLNSDIPGSPFGFVFDRGCFHCIDSGEERGRFAKKVAGLLDEAGLWLSLAGNADEPPREIGPPRLTARELVAAVEPHCEIISLTAGFFGANQPDPPKAWICLMRKRTTGIK